MSEYTKVEMRLCLMFRPDLYSSTRCIIPYIYGSEFSSLYTCNTSWCSVYYMILNKPLVRLTTAHYQSTVSMISFAQILTAQWSDTIPCRNVRFQVGITSHDIPFQQKRVMFSDGRTDTRTQILNLFIFLTILNFALNIYILHHLIMIQFF